MATTASDAPPTSPPPSPAENRFFAWMRLLDVPRRPGWLGGVCAGVAYRLGIDPLIVRGIAVVIAILGGPVFLLYAAGWLLLPDLEGRIHLQRLIQGIFDRALVGIVAVFVLGLLPVAQGFWALSAGYWGDGSAFGAVQRAFWTLIVIAAAIVATIWIARTTRAAAGAPPTSSAPTSSPDSSPATFPATTDDRPDTIPQFEAAPATVAEPAAGEAMAPAIAPVEPATPAPGASEDTVAAWRERQAEWKVQFDAWKAAQAADAKEQRLRRQAEARTRAAEAAAASAERRRIHRLNNPRLGGSLTAMVLGLSLLAGGIAAVIATGSADWQGAEVATGLAVATITVGLGIVLAGAFKRRAGFLGFVSVLLVLATVTAGFVPRDRQVLGVRESVSSGRFMQLAGSVNIRPSAESEPVLDLWQGAGVVSITIPDDLTVRVETIQDDDNRLELASISADGEYAIPTSLAVDRDDDESTYRATYGTGRPDVTVRVWQGAGAIRINAPTASVPTTSIPNEGTNQ